MQFSDCQGASAVFHITLLLFPFSQIQLCDCKVNMFKKLFLWQVSNSPDTWLVQILELKAADC